jgi:hypothetical protein
MFYFLQYILNTSGTYKLCTLTTTVSPTQDIIQRPLPPQTSPSSRDATNLVEIGTGEYADEERIATTSMSASCVSRKDIPVTSARERVLREVLDLRAKQPHWVRDLMWTDLDLGISHAALWTRSAAPLPQVPLKEFHNLEAMNTISSHPDLFKIITPINVPQFKDLLVDHPNQPLVDSVVHGLTHGF